MGAIWRGFSWASARLRTSRRVRWSVAGLLVGLWWYLGPGAFEYRTAFRWELVATVLTVVASAWVTAVLARSHRWLLVAMVLASPFVVISAWASARAAVGYARGNAVVIQWGMASHPRLEPRLRIPVRSLGCVITPTDLLVGPVNNATLELLVATLGPMPGSYLGPLVDEGD